MKKLLLLSLFCFLALSMKAPSAEMAAANGFVNLGLHSGTLWKAKNEAGYFTYDQAVARYGKSLPTKAQLEELTTRCTWTWTGNGYRVKGPNGNSIELQAQGYSHNDSLMRVGALGYYWSSTPDDSDGGWGLYFNAKNHAVYGFVRNFGRSVRLVAK